MTYILLLYLLISTIMDIRAQKLPAVWLYSGLIGIGLYAFWQLVREDRAIVDQMCALLPGVICYFFAKISKAMGVGDALLILGMGFGFSLMTVTRILILAFFLSAIGSIAVLLYKKNMKNRRIPFVPYLFLASGYLLVG